MYVDKKTEEDTPSPHIPEAEATVDQLYAKVDKKKKVIREKLKCVRVILWNNT